MRARREPIQTKAKCPLGCADMQQARPKEWLQKGNPTEIWPQGSYASAETPTETRDSLIGPHNSSKPESLEG